MLGTNYFSGGPGAIPHPPPPNFDSSSFATIPMGVGKLPQILIVT